MNRQDRKLQMQAFINALIDEFFPECGDIDGATFQELAEKHGIFVPEIRHTPCGESCSCAQVCNDSDWKRGVTCYRTAKWLKE